MSETTLLNSPDKELLDEIVETTEDTVSYYLSISEKLVKSYTEDFDELMSDLKEDLVDNEPTDIILEKYVLELNNKLYFLGDKLESVGIRDDLSKMASREVFNNAYLSSREKDTERRNKTTVAELTAIAEDTSRYQSVLNSIYSRVYKQIKLKMDAGYDMVNTLRKVISRRMQEASLSATYKPVMPEVSRKDGVYN